MYNYNKYTRQFYPVKNPTRKWVSKTYIEKAPTWCSVDLRDGNQALVIPMNLDEKLDFFKMLVDIGFKEIEIGFPAASQTEYEFLRALIDRELIPDDVTVQVLTQAREHIIYKTFEALDGCRNAIVHLYNSTSFAQREQVFRKSRKEILKLAVDGARMFNDIAADMGVAYRYEYSPESFTGTEPEYALEVCNAVLDVWKPDVSRKAIINLPVTVELSSPHVYADQVEYMCDNLLCRDAIEVSLHPHNDRGCAVADCELGLLAGADRIEGTLFGNGERTGNADIVTLAMNMYAQGVDPGLDFTNMPQIAELYEDVTRMQVSPRQPYAGKLVFAAFSGSHQDAIAKSMKYREETGATTWTVPYLPIDPADVGREYETSVIRINSQSGGGGIGYLLERNFGYVLPKKMRQDVGYMVKAASDHAQGELSPAQVLKLFTDNYININTYIKLVDYHYVRDPDIVVTLTVEVDGKEKALVAGGNGRLDAVSNAVKKHLGIQFSNLTYEEHALTAGSSSQAITYVSITLPDGRVVWGAGIHDDIIASSVNALFSAINRSIQLKK